MRKIFLAANSQGTSIGISEEFCYPNILEKSLGRGFDVHRMLVSGWTLRDFVNNLADNVLPLMPDLVIMHFGIIEASQRILSNTEKRFLSLIPGNSIVSRALHRSRPKVLRLRNALGLTARQVTFREYSDAVNDASRILNDRGVKYLFLKTPSFADDGHALRHPFINQDIKQYNSALVGHPSISIDGCENSWSISDFQHGTVHFSESGHRKIAKKIKRYIELDMSSTNELV